MFREVKEIEDIGKAVVEWCEEGREGELSVEVFNDNVFMCESTSDTRPGPSYAHDFSKNSVIATDGIEKQKTVEHTYNYPTTDYTLYETRIENASFIVLASYNYKSWGMQNDNANIVDYRLLFRNPVEAEKIKQLIDKHSFSESETTVLCSLCWEKAQCSICGSEVDDEFVLKLGKQRVCFDCV